MTCPPDPQEVQVQGLPLPDRQEGQGDPDRRPCTKEEQGSQDKGPHAEEGQGQEHQGSPTEGEEEEQGSGAGGSSGKKQKKEEIVSVFLINYFCLGPGKDGFALGLSSRCRLDRGFYQAAKQTGEARNRRGKTA